MIKNLIVGVAAFAGVVLSGGIAKADYVCAATFVPGSSTAGSYGYILVQLTTGQNCTGSNSGAYNLCSANATIGTCSGSALYRYQTADQIATMAKLMSEAVVHNYYVSVTTGTCNGGGGTCAQYVTFTNLY